MPEIVARERFNSLEATSSMRPGRLVIAPPTTELVETVEATNWALTYE